MTVGERIQKYAKEKGMTLKQVATEAGISYSTIYAIVKRKSDGVKPDTIESIAAALQISPSQLYWDKPLSDALQFRPIKISIKNGKPKDIKNCTIDLDADKAGRLLTIHASDEFLNFIKNHQKLDGSFQEDIEKIVAAYISLSDIGRKKMAEYAQDLTKIQEYQNK